MANHFKRVSYNLFFCSSYARGTIIPPTCPKEQNYEYRVKETIPAGWVNAGEVQYSAISDYNSTDNKFADLTLNNSKPAKLILEKKKVSGNTSNAATTAAEPDVQFDLYRTTNGTTFEKVNQDVLTTDSEGQISQIVSADDGNGNAYTYYWVEVAQPAGEIWQTDTTITIDGVQKKAVKAGPFTAETTEQITSTTYNVEQKVVVIVKKADVVTDALLANASFTLNGSTITITNKDAGVRSQLPAGTTYTLHETTAPAGYELTAADQTVDLTGITAVYDVEHNTIVYKKGNTTLTDEDLTYIMKDKPYVKVKVTKQLTGIDQAVSDYNASFTVYKKNSDGTFSEYHLPGTTAAITITANSGEISLPSGTDYYLHENADTTVVLDPDEYYSKYTGGEYDSASQQYYFGPYTVPEKTTSTVEPVVLNGTNKINNIQSYTSLKVTKVIVDKDGNPITDTEGSKNVTMTVKVLKDGNLVDAKDNKGNTVAAHTTGDDGSYTFTNLPVYDSDGNKITYVVVESYGATDPRQSIYYPVPVEGGTAGQASTQLTENAVAEVTIKNAKYLSITATKIYYEVWEQSLTGLTYLMPGATIALYRRATGTPGNWERVGEQQTTDASGSTTFGQLLNGYDYRVVEVTVPAGYISDHMEPSQGAYISSGTAPATMTDAEMAATYNVQATYNTAGDAFNGVTFTNLIHWSQMNIKKFETYDYLSDLSNANRLDGARFTLYKQVLPEGTHSGALTFNASNCTVVGEYVSGTLEVEDNEGHKIDPSGEFNTDIFEVADNVVYWLVETYPTTGHDIYPQEEIILIAREGTTYTNNNDPATRVEYYPDDNIGTFNIQNEILSGPGPGDSPNTAYLRLYKWMLKKNTGSADTTIPMPGAVFDLYLVDSDGKRYEKLDTITTGLDSYTPDGVDPSGVGVSKAIQGQYLYFEYKDKIGTEITQEEFDKIFNFVPDPQYPNSTTFGTFYANMALVEVETSPSYRLDVETHYLTMVFVEGDLSIGNEVYYVITSDGGTACDQTDLDNSVATASQLADGSIRLMNYPTSHPAVALQHFGYDPLDDLTNLVNKTAQQMDAVRGTNPGLFDSVNVKFYLMHMNGSTPEYWNYITNTRTTTQTEAETGSAYPAGEPMPITGM